MTTNLSSALTNNTTVPNAAASSAASALTGTVAQKSAQTTQAGQQELSSNFSQFLKLLTTQLQNQDPLNPMDSAAFTQQLVEYSQVEQQLNTNSKLDNLTTLSQNSSLSLALGYVGKQITYTSAEMNFNGSTPVDVSYNLPTTAGTAVANVTDEATGNVIDSFPVSGTSGNNKVTWDGKNSSGTAVAAGTYSIQIAATDSKSGTLETVTTAVSGLVSGIESQDGVPALLVGARSVPLGNVIDTSLPPAASTTGT